jgi:uncharacterized protein YyaL (SSP411 family)
MTKNNNRLAKESSPYLLQHANNPVDWFPWCDEALKKARLEDKPILVSIGYSTCHWCHVMEHESFENVEVAAFMNENFVNIKVDREERPDLDSIYMEAIQMVTGGHGGWPLNCFLLPDGRPFYGGTYFPPRQSHGRASWMMVLKNISNAYTTRRTEVMSQADKLMAYIEESDNYFVSEMSDPESTGKPFDVFDLEHIFFTLEDGFDKVDGGFGYAPKFPSTMSLRFCLNYYHHSGNILAMEQLQLSLDAMIYGGIYDQLGGGFSRYSVDKVWLLPHFEKMLYDNALLVSLLSDTYKAVRKPLYKETVEETLAWVEREVLSPEGGFYSAVDADSEGIEGKFYVWSKSEIDSILGTDADLFSKFYDVTAEGNWEHSNILHRPQSFAGFAKQHQLVEEELRTTLLNNRKSLLHDRENRIRPGLDDKILLSWNAMMCSAYCKAYQAFENPNYKNIALRNIDFLLEKFSKPDGSIFHDYKNGKAKTDGFLDDYALLIEALLSCYEISFKKSLLFKAKQLTDLVLTDFLDKNENLFFYTGTKQKDIVIRKKDLYDNAVPSGNSTMIKNLQVLGTLLNVNDYLGQALKSLLPMKESIRKYPQSFAKWADTIFFQVYPVKEIALVGENHKEMALELQKNYIPNVLFAAANLSDSELPLLKGRDAANGKTMIFVCSNYNCKLPVDNVEEALKLLQ